MALIWHLEAILATCRRMRRQAENRVAHDTALRRQTTQQMVPEVMGALGQSEMHTFGGSPRSPLVTLSKLIVEVKKRKVNERAQSDA